MIEMQVYYKCFAQKPVQIIVLELKFLSKVKLTGLQGLKIQNPLQLTLTCITPSLPFYIKLCS